jgi:hypothetical protein
MILEVIGPGLRPDHEEEAVRAKALAELKQQIKDKKFNEFLQQASEWVNQWPAWKRGILGREKRDTRETDDTVAR